MPGLDIGNMKAGASPCMVYVSHTEEIADFCRRVGCKGKPCNPNASEFDPDHSPTCRMNPFVDVSKQ